MRVYAGRVKLYRFAKSFDCVRPSGFAISLNASADQGLGIGGSGYLRDHQSRGEQKTNEQTHNRFQFD